MKRIEFISVDEFSKLYTSAKKKDLKLAMLLGFGAGMRISEIIGLKAETSKCCNVIIEKRIMT